MKNISKLDCATFVNYVYRNYFCAEIMKNGIGNSWTGKILTSDCGEFVPVDEKNP